MPDITLKMVIRHEVVNIW